MELYSTDGNEEIVMPISGMGELCSPGCEVIAVHAGCVLYNPLHTPHDVFNSSNVSLSQVYIVEKAYWLFQGKNLLGINSQIKPLVKCNNCVYISTILDGWESYMKRKLYFLVLAFFLVTLVFTSAPKTVQAGFNWSSNMAGNSWNTGSEFNIDLEATPAPNDWMQLLSKGVVTSEPGTICHPIEPSKYGWVAYIYQLVDGAWVKLDTTYAWMPNEEGTYNACAITYTAGTYALFGYYDSAKDETKGTKSVEESDIECDFDFYGQYWDYGDSNTDWDAKTFNLAFYVPASIFQTGDPVTYSIINVIPAGAITSRLTGSTNLGAAGTSPFGLIVPALFTKTITYNAASTDSLPMFTVHLYFPNEACYKNVQIQMLYLYGDDD